MSRHATKALVSLLLSRRTNVNLILDCSSFSCNVTVRHLTIEPVKALLSILFTILCMSACCSMACVTESRQVLKAIVVAEFNTRVSVLAIRL